MSSHVLSAALGTSVCVGCGITGSLLCWDCAAHLEIAGAPATVGLVDRVVVAWDYRDAARDLVLALKLRGRRDAAGPLVDAMAAAAHIHGLTAEILTWVPGRARDKRRRGFDHAELLARGLASKLGLPAAPLLRRVSDPPDQTSLSRAERRRNLAGVFEGTTRGAGRVAIVDDLVTTGATLTACAGALRATSAIVVEALVACRA